MQEEEDAIPQMVEDVRAGRMPRRKFMKAFAALGISAAGVSAVSSAVARRFKSLTELLMALKSWLNGPPRALIPAISLDYPPPTVPFPFVE
jgi:hypothetical protein